MKKLIALSLVAVLVLGLTACGKKTMKCDGCGKDVLVDSKMDESWTVFCADCEPDIDLD